MTDHLTPHDTDTSDDAFDRLARSAGAELRRPAPADGMQRLRTARRRQQVTRSVVAGGAAVLLVGMGTFVALRGTDDAGDLATQPDPTVPEPTVVPTTIPEPAPTTVPEPTPTTVPPTPTTVPTNDEVEGWLTLQRTEGRTLVYRAAGDGTDAYGLVAQSPEADDSAGIVVLPTGETFAMPDEVATGISPTMRIHGVGESIAVIAHLASFSTTAGSVPIELHVLDPATGAWNLGPDLGLDRALGQGLHVLSVDGSLVVGRSVWDELEDFSAVPSPDRAGVIVRPDLTVEPITTPPDGVQMSWTSSFDRWAVNFGYEPGALNYSSYTQPWKLDVATNEWSPITLPEWYSCEPGFGCEWVTPHESGDRFLEVVTPRGVLKRLPDATVGIYDPASDAWTQMDDAPFALALPAIALLGDRVVVAPMRAPYTVEEQDDFGQVGVLDLSTGTWSVERFEVTEEDTRWELRVDGAGVIAQPVPIDPSGTLDLGRSIALDRDTADWRPATATDAERWTAAAAQVDLAS